MFTLSSLPASNHLHRRPGNITKKQSLKSRKGKGGNEEKSPEKTPKQSPKISWNDMIESNDAKDLAYPHLDYINFEPMPVSSSVVGVGGFCL